MLSKSNRFRKGFWQLADPKIWIASTVPMLVGSALAFGLTGSFNLYWFAVALIGIYCIEIGKNAVNEVVDYQSGVDRYVTPEQRTPFSGGKKTIVDGLLTVAEARSIAIATLAAGAIIGLYIAFSREPLVLWVGLLGLFFAAFYSLPPLKFSYRGLGEMAVGFTFGPLITSGAYLVQAHTLSPLVILTSLPIGFLIANVLWINQYPDYEADRKGKKLNGVVRLGKKQGVKVFAALFAAAYLSLIALFIASGNPFWLLPFLTLGMAKRAVSVAREYHDYLPRQVEANARTIQTYQLSGAAMVFAALLSRISLF